MVDVMRGAGIHAQPAAGMGSGMMGGAGAAPPQGMGQPGSAPFHLMGQSMRAPPSGIVEYLPLSGGGQPAHLVGGRGGPPAPPGLNPRPPRTAGMGGGMPQGPAGLWGPCNNPDASACSQSLVGGPGGSLTTGVVCIVRGYPPGGPGPPDGAGAARSGHPPGCLGHPGAGAGRSGYPHGDPSHHGAGVGTDAGAGSGYAQGSAVGGGALGAMSGRGGSGSGYPPGGPPPPLVGAVAVAGQGGAVGGGSQSRRYPMGCTSQGGLTPPGGGGLASETNTGSASMGPEQGPPHGALPPLLSSHQHLLAQPSPSPVHPPGGPPPPAHTSGAAPPRLGTQGGPVGGQGTAAASKLGFAILLASGGNVSKVAAALALLSPSQSASLEGLLANSGGSSAAFVASKIQLPHDHALSGPPLSTTGGSTQAEPPQWPESTEASHATWGP
eukprot:gene7748-925_t